MKPEGYPDRSIMLHWLALASFIFLVLSARGQVAPDIARGTPAGVVIQKYGWPKGRSAAEGRESWMYDSFDVLLEGGRVVQVTPLPPSKTKQPPRTSLPTQRPAVPYRAAPPSQPPAKPAPHAQGTHPGQTRSNFPPTSTSSAVQKRTASVPPSRPQTSAKQSEEGWLLLLIPIGGAVAAAAFILAQRMRQSREVAPAGESAPQLWPTTFEEHMAQRLGKGGRQSPVPPPVAPSHDSGDELTPELLRALEWKRFEELVAQYFNATGVRAVCTCIGPDGGVDVKLFRAADQQPYGYVQCKAWGTEKVKLTNVREFLGVMAADCVSEGAYVTTSEFRPEARAFAEDNRIAAIDGKEFLRRFQTLPSPVRRQILSEVTRGDYRTPSCPACDTKMVWKASAGFWACPRYPRCRSSPIHPRKSL